MVKCAEKDAPPLDPADVDRAYHNYIENCRRLGAEPMPWDRAQALMAEWADAIADSAKFS